MSRTAIIIVAGGGGRRMGEGLPKQFRLLGSKPILIHTINRFHEALPEAQLIVVLPAHLIDFWHNLSARFEVARHKVVTGGEERFHSVKKGLAAVGFDVEIVGVHDAVRPLASVEMIRSTVAEADRYGTAIPVITAVDSYRIVEGERSSIVDRSKLRIVQTPQVFRRALLDEAYEQPYRPTFTDDGSVVEALGLSLRLTEGERSNLKITTIEDLIIAESLLQATSNRPEQASNETP